jgi:hypothetical protein
VWDVYAPGRQNETATHSTKTTKQNPRRIKKAAKSRYIWDVMVAGTTLFSANIDIEYKVICWILSSFGSC